MITMRWIAVVGLVAGLVGCGTASDPGDGGGAALPSPSETSSARLAVGGIT